jgi:hypothetical protein
MRNATPLGLGMEMTRLSTQMGLMMAEANMVILMRLWGMAGFWDVTPHENRRMFSEKSSAMRDSAFAAARAASLGHSPAGIAQAALKPVRHRTKSNVRRLTRRGPGVKSS